MFGKKEDHNLIKLKEGDTLKVQGHTWIIKELVDYDWGVDGKSIEYKIQTSDGQIAYLEVERYEGDYEIIFNTPASFTTMTLEEAINSKSIVYNGILFDLDEQYQGSAKNQTLPTSWENVKNYIFYNESEEMIIIEIFAGKDPEAFYGLGIKEKSIKNIKAS